MHHKAIALVFIYSFSMEQGVVQESSFTFEYMMKLTRATTTVNVVVGEEEGMLSRSCGFHGFK